MPTRAKRELLLAIETSGDVCGVAALRGGEPMAEHTFRHGMHLSEHLISHVDAVLKEAEGQLSEVSAYAVGIGPGSFTGTRIGVMTAKTLAAVQERPIYGIGGMEALALEYGGVRDLVVPLLPCRAATVFAALYDVRTGWPVKRVAPGVMTIAELAEVVRHQPENGILCCGEGAERHRADLEQTLGSISPVGFGQVRFPRASIVGMLAWRRFVGGDPGEDALAVVPLYLAPPPITMPGGAPVPRYES